MILDKFVNMVLDPLRGLPESKSVFPYDIQPKDPDYITFGIEVQDGSKFTITFREMEEPGES